MLFHRLCCCVFFRPIAMHGGLASGSRSFCSHSYGKLAKRGKCPKFKWNNAHHTYWHQVCPNHRPNEIESIHPTVAHQLFIHWVFGLIEKWIKVVSCQSLSNSISFTRLLELFNPVWTLQFESAPPNHFQKGGNGGRGSCVIGYMLVNFQVCLLCIVDLSFSAQISTYWPLNFLWISIESEID